MELKDLSVKKIERKTVETENDTYDKFSVKFEGTGVSGTLVFDEEPSGMFHGGETLAIQIKNSQKKLEAVK